MNLLKKNLNKEVNRLFKLNIASKKENKTIQVIKECVDSEIEEYIQDNLNGRNLFTHMNSIMNEVYEEYGIKRNKGVPSTYRFYTCFASDYDQFDETKVNLDQIMKNLLEAKCLTSVQKKQTPPRLTSITRSLSYLLRFALEEKPKSIQTQECQSELLRMKATYGEVQKFDSLGTVAYIGLNKNFAGVKYVSYIRKNISEIRAAQKQISDNLIFDYITLEDVITFTFKIREELRTVNLLETAEVFSELILNTFNQMEKSKVYKSQIIEKMIKLYN